MVARLLLNDAHASSQIVVWMTAAVVGHGVSSILVCLGMNDEINQIAAIFACSSLPTIIPFLVDDVLRTVASMTICATRLHRTIAILSTPVDTTPRTANPVQLMPRTALVRNVPSSPSSIANSTKTRSRPGTATTIQVHRSTTVVTDDGMKISEDELFAVSKVDNLKYACSSLFVARKVLMSSLQNATRDCSSGLRAICVFLG